MAGDDRGQTPGLTRLEFKTRPNMAGHCADVDAYLLEDMLITFWFHAEIVSYTISQWRPGHRLCLTWYQDPETAMCYTPADDIASGSLNLFDRAYPETVIARLLAR
jgi:hypothetical protein